MKVYKMQLAGRELSIETGRIAKQASGSVVLRYGDTVVLSTATASAEPREGVDFFPMTVDYEERLYAVGKIPGGFIKREGRPTEKAILSARLTDRPCRPLFPKGFRNAVHIVTTVLSVDQDNPPEVLSIVGASAALSISNIPFAGPLSAVVVGWIDGKPVINPNQEQAEQSKLHLVVASTKDGIMMVEAGAHELTEDEVLEAIMAGDDANKEIVALQEQMVAEVGQEKMQVNVFQPDAEVAEQVRQFCSDKVAQAVRTIEKHARETAISEAKKETIEHFAEIFPENEKDVKVAFENLVKETMRTMILKENLRPDGRKSDEIRPVTSEVGILPRTHGSGLFTRGQTQVLNVCTLGAPGEVQRLDGLGLEESKRYMHHYNFPPYSVGEAGFMRGASRRDIGHGALAEKALVPVLPSEEDFPYTIRLVSEVVESNGSSSMGSVCGSTLSMMDAGVPLKKPVSGVAMGLIVEGDDVAILSDIQGMEDFLGDMDFKVAGTPEGITALQMDIKIKGLSREILTKALQQAKDGYMHIMNKMTEVIPEPRKELSPHAPRIMTININPDKIRDVIGPGGKMINKIVAETDADIDIEPDGTIYIAAVSPESGKKALEMIESLTKEVQPGEVYTGKVTRVEKYGAFVEILPGKDGLVHISRLAHERVEKTEDVVNIGDEIPVKVIGIDDRGRIDLSRRAAIPNAQGEMVEEEPPQRRDDRRRSNDRDRRPRRT
ncbi:polyribonucleotide nucleotidyltransferase [Dethiobacter alkaliphilus]|uniref:Polyribonucleotide nucleotidyltransferase n=1 Tax=Dethiobacter alkaliphilus AHT 1 TaxID=555088 RepID=C0GIW5_DETAL|nr:polyribonucleotide nucleotidyltransferase [Dethiobacter alkaliphilus]EEG76779.1 Polyribonucleotide nucleotidyltransferase [Dethiobacter alkaliphilus AHT 1]